MPPTLGSSTGRAPGGGKVGAGARSGARAQDTHQRPGCVTYYAEPTVVVYECFLTTPGSTAMTCMHIGKRTCNAHTPSNAPLTRHGRTPLLAVTESSSPSCVQRALSTFLLKITSILRRSDPCIFDADPPTRSAQIHVTCATVPNLHADPAKLWTHSAPQGKRRNDVRRGRRGAQYEYTVAIFR